MEHISGQGRLSANPQAGSEESLQFQHKHKSGRSLGRPKSSEKDLKSSWHGNKSCDDEELVKHMSNLPDFLQRVEKEKSIQEKALNFGVLDWKRLEKWKYNERMPDRAAKRTLSSSQGRVPSSLSGKHSSLHDARPCLPQRQQPPPRSMQLSSSKEVRNYASYHKEEKYNGSAQKTKGNDISNRDYQAAQITTTDQHRYHYNQRAQSYNSSCSGTNAGNSGKRKDPKKETIFQKKVSSSDQGKHEVSPSPPNNINALNEHLSEAAGQKLSCFFSMQEFYLGERSAGVPRSCPLPVSAAVHAECTMESEDLATSNAGDLKVHANANSTVNSRGKCSTVLHSETSKSSSLVEGSLKTQADVSEQQRASSPSHRFSFSLGKMSRSVSSKGVVLSTVKSSQLRPHLSSTTNSTERVKESATSRRRSSPLKRLLDPLLKYKGAQSAEIVHLENRNLYSVTSTAGTIKEPYRDRYPNTKASTFQALLQLSFKNGLPYFKLVVENSEDMLAATLKRLPTCGKSDPCTIYTFYSVHEIKKKSLNWLIGQGSSNSKTCNLGYNIVGQMKISNFNHPDDSGECNEMECVLYGINPGQVEKQTVGFIPNKEIAAIIMKNQVYASTTTLEADKNELLDGTVVVLPGGVHSVPVKGMASSLISRWKSGGVCDCGGWDVGCKLRILSDHKMGSRLQDSNVDYVRLFAQGEDEKNKPSFSLKLLRNGLYSIESEASISLLEAFSICVAYVTCSKFPEIVYMKGMPNAGMEKRKTATTLHDQFPARYVSCPPLSPTGRI